MQFFSGQKILITGSSRGIGRACALEFAKQGAHVAINYRQQKESAEELVQEIKALGVNAVAIQADVSIPEEAENLVTQAIAHLGGLDVLVNNAGIWIQTPMGTTHNDTIDLIIDVNLKSMIYTCNTTVPYFQKQGHGRIINISSTAGQRGEAHYSVYASTKGAIISYTKSLSTELASDRILVNAVAPGWVDTELNDPVFKDPSNKARIASTIPLGKIPTATEIAGAVLFLSSPWSEVITGEVINVNGGSVLCG